MSIIPLDGIQYLVDSDDVATINMINDPGVDYVAQMWNQQFGWGGPFLIWDTITATAVTNPENFYWTYDGVEVITEPGDFQGQTIALNNGATHTRYATGADYEAILDQLFETFREETTPWDLTDSDSSDISSTATVTIGSEILITELDGTWEGFTGDFQITFNLETECKLNQKCGIFEITEYSLSGDVLFIDVSDDVYEFKTTNLSYEVETELLEEYLQMQDDGTLLYVSIGVSGRSEAILERK